MNLVCYASRIPLPIYAGLVRYLDRVPPGSFLRACLENNLQQAVSRADPKSLAQLVEITLAVQALPEEAHGSPEKVREWLAGRKETT